MAMLGRMDLLKQLGLDRLCASLSRLLLRIPVVVVLVGIIIRVRILVRVLRPIGRTRASQLLVARLWPRGVLVGLHFYDAEQARNHLGLLQHRLSRGLHLGLEILHLQRKERGRMPIRCSRVLFRRARDAEV
jgi:hypothetical protein